MHYNIKELSSVETYRYLTHLVAPRPIALVSTINKQGSANLSPFSFFNLFSSNPPVVIFSPLRRMGDNTMKHTLHNVLEVPEVVINIVTKDIIAQTSLSSFQYNDGIDEFIKAGFTKEAAVIVKPPMVLEAKAKLECRVTEVKPLGNKGGAGNLVICEVLYMHVDDTLYNEEGKFDPHKLNLAARLGADFYSEISSQNLFSLPKPSKAAAIGMDGLPEWIRKNRYLSGYELSLLATVEELPDINTLFTDDRFEAIDTFLKEERREQFLYHYVKELIYQHQLDHAWQVLLHAQQKRANKKIIEFSEQK